MLFAVQEEGGRHRKGKQEPRGSAGALILAMPCHAGWRTTTVAIAIEVLLLASLGVVKRAASCGQARPTRPNVTR